MNYKSIFITATMAILAMSTVTAQTDTRDQLKSYSFVEAQGGIQLTATDANMSKLITPTAALSFGHFFTPVVGARLNVNGWKAKAGFSDPEQYYKWNYITPSADLMITTPTSSPLSRSTCSTSCSSEVWASTMRGTTTS